MAFSEFFEIFGFISNIKKKQTRPAFFLAFLWIFFRTTIHEFAR